MVKNKIVLLGIMQHSKVNGSENASSKYPKSLNLRSIIYHKVLFMGDGLTICVGLNVFIALYFNWNNIGKSLISYHLHSMLPRSGRKKWRFPTEIPLEKCHIGNRRPAPRTHIGQTPRTKDKIKKLSSSQLPDPDRDFNWTYQTLMWFCLKLLLP